MTPLRLLGWVLLAGGGLLGLVALAIAAVGLFGTGAIWLGGGKFTEGLGALLIGVVVVVVILLLSAVALVAGFLILASTVHP